MPLFLMYSCHGSPVAAHRSSRNCMSILGKVYIYYFYTTINEANEGRENSTRVSMSPNEEPSASKYLRVGTYQPATTALSRLLVQTTYGSLFSEVGKASKLRLSVGISYAHRLLDWRFRSSPTSHRVMSKNQQFGQQSCTGIGCSPPKGRLTRFQMIV